MEIKNSFSKIKYMSNAMKFTTLENSHPMDVYWRAGQSHDANPVSAFQSLSPTADPDQNTAAVPTIPIICQIKTLKLN